MMERGRRGAFWQAKEVEVILDKLLDMGAVARVMRSTHLPTMSQFRRVARTLTHTHGYPCTAKQCRWKIKALCCAFFHALEAWQGIPRLSGRPPHYNKLLRL